MAILGSFFWQTKLENQIYRCAPVWTKLYGVCISTRLGLWALMKDLPLRWPIASAKERGHICMYWMEMTVCFTHGGKRKCQMGILSRNGYWKRSTLDHRLSSKLHLSMRLAYIIYKWSSSNIWDNTSGGDFGTLSRTILCLCRYSSRLLTMMATIPWVLSKIDWSAYSLLVLHYLPSFVGFW